MFLWFIAWIVWSGWIKTWAEICGNALVACLKYVKSRCFDPFYSCSCLDTCHRSCSQIAYLLILLLKTSFCDLFAGMSISQFLMSACLFATTFSGKYCRFNKHLFFGASTTNLFCISNQSINLLHAWPASDINWMWMQVSLRSKRQIIKSNLAFPSVSLQTQWWCAMNWHQEDDQNFVYVVMQDSWPRMESKQLQPPAPHRLVHSHSSHAQHTRPSTAISPCSIASTKFPILHSRSINPTRQSALCCGTPSKKVESMKRSWLCGQWCTCSCHQSERFAAIWSLLVLVIRNQSPSPE